MFKPFYPSVLCCNPIHEVRNWAYVRKIMRAVIAGETVNPILVDEKDGSLLAGTHRAAANNLLEMLGYDERIEVVEFVDLDESHEHYAELKEAVDECDYERIDAIWGR